MRFVKLTLKNSPWQAIDAAPTFWQRARIPTRNIDKCVGKLLKKTLAK